MPLLKKNNFRQQYSLIYGFLVVVSVPSGHNLGVVKKYVNQQVKQWVVGLLAMMLPSALLLGQYSDNPLRGKRWYTIGAGINSSDYWSWQTAMTYSKRGDGSLVQARVAFTQELWMAADDSCTDRHNRLTELGILWGDGWAGKRWYATGSIGFGFNMRMYCRKADYENEYITGLTLGVPVQIEAGVLLGKKSGLSLIGMGNWNFREPYLGAQLAFYHLLSL